MDLLVANSAGSWIRMVYVLCYLDLGLDSPIFMLIQSIKKPKILVAAL